MIGGSLEYTIRSLSCVDVLLNCGYSDKAGRAM